MLHEANVLITGGAGFIGSNLIKRLRTEECHIRATLHSQPPQVEFSDVEYAQADLTRLEDCYRVVNGIDIVFMCAAKSSGAAIMELSPISHVTPNIVMNAQMLEASYVAGVKKFLFISSSTVYPPTGDRPVCESEMLAGEPYRKYYPVGWMKRYSEILCETYARRLSRPMSTVVVRPSNVYGPYDNFDFRTSHMVAALTRRVVERHNPLEVWGGGDDIKDLIYVDDFIDGLLRALQESADYLAVNIAAGRGYSVREVLKTILEIDGYEDAKIIFDPSKPTMIPIRLLDTKLARESLGFQATTSLPQGLNRVVEWYRESLANP